MYVVCPTCGPVKGPTIVRPWGQTRGKETDKYGFLFLLPFGGLYVPFGQGTFFACRQRVSAAQNITVPPRCLSKPHVGAHARKAVKHTRKGLANEDVHSGRTNLYAARTYA